MQPATPRKYRFRIRTRNGLEIGRIDLHARDAEHAEKKVQSMYPLCEVLAREDRPFSAQMQHFLSLGSLVAERASVR